MVGDHINAVLGHPGNDTFRVVTAGVIRSKDVVTIGMMLLDEWNKQPLDALRQIDALADSRCSDTTDERLGETLLAHGDPDEHLRVELLLLLTPNS